MWNRSLTDILWREKRRKWKPRHLEPYRKLRQVEVLPNDLLKKTIREAKEINKDDERSQMRMTGYKEKCTIGFIEDGPQDR